MKEIEKVTEEKIMVIDYSEFLLRLDRDLRTVYELMLKNKWEDGRELLLDIANVAVITASLIAEQNIDIKYEDQ